MAGSGIYFYGIATDEPTPSTEPAGPDCAVGDVMYYGREIVTVDGWYRDDNDRVMINITITRTGEEKSVPRSCIRF